MQEQKSCVLRMVIDMFGLSDYKHLYGNANSEGHARKLQSDMIMEYTWDRDIQSLPCYLYDCYHDDEKDKVRNLNSLKSKTKTLIQTKYIVNAYQSDDKDQVSYHIQFKPSQKCNVPYYYDVFESRYDSLFPLGLYIDIPDQQGIYNRWLVTEKANYYNPQFITWSILPCDYKFQWIFENKKYEMWGVLRSQNSYNSGIWTDYKITTLEDQQKFILPLNRDSEKLYHNQRMVIDARVESQPITWCVSKIKRLAPNGLVRITLAEDRFDQHHDYIERDTSGNIIGMWCDYFNSDIDINNPELEEKNIHTEISYSGTKSELKVGGSYKTFTVSYFDNNSELLEKTDIKPWSFTIDGKDFDTDALLKIIYPSSTNKLEENQIKVKFIGSDDYLGSIICIKNDSAILEVKIVGI